MRYLTIHGDIASGDADAAPRAGRDALPLALVRPLGGAHLQQVATSTIFQYVVPGIREECSS